ncbi:MAG: hypothetical protein KC458_07755 [Dehalococcoidia bacterium]|nr:hypothetical protein [Dehalococcoidia bacterium]MCA9857156.1 hypothetical protein [Dehalococcoidia bacterium]
MTRMRSMALLFAAAVLSVAMIACSDDEAGDGDTSPTATSPVATAPAGSTTPGSATPGPDSPVSSDDPTPSGTHEPRPADDFDRVEVPAPIESAEVLFLESFPVQHHLHIVSGLPSGCAQFVGAEVERDGTTFTVTVTNSVPAPDQEVACTAIYGYQESNVDLGNDLEAGTEYTVNVNDMTLTFVAE